MDFTRFDPDQTAHQNRLDIQANLYEFAQAKTYTQLQAFGELLYQDGQLRSFEDFKKQVLKRHEDYNLNYLQAEYQTARQASHHARQWQRFEKDKDLFPSLVYKTVGDARVRAAHKSLHGVVKALEDPFWNTHYPPNGWRCRCYVVQSTQRPVPLATYEPVQGSTRENPVDPAFEVNTGKSGRIYSDKHPYFVLARSAPKPVQQAFERAKLHAPYWKAYQSKTGATVKVSPFTDKEDLKARYQTALILADKGMQVKLPAHIALEGHKNFPYQIDGKAAARKVQDREDVASILELAQRQAVAILVFEIQPGSPHTLRDFACSLKQKLKTLRHGETPATDPSKGKSP